MEINQGLTGASKNKKIVIIIAVCAVILAVVLAVVLGFSWLKSKNASKSLDDYNQAQNAVDDALQSITSELGTDPLKNKPNINPADNANPIKNIKVNPFE